MVSILQGKGHSPKKRYSYYRNIIFNMGNREDGFSQAKKVISQ